MSELHFTDQKPEEWRAVVGYEDYEVSDLGRVRRVGRGPGAKVGRVLATYIDRCGYKCLRFRRRTVSVHALVLAAFLGPRPTGLQTNHRNGIKIDNRLANLERVTPRENILHAVAMGLQAQAKRRRCPRGHPYSGANLYRYGNNRRCRACRRVEQRNFRARQKWNRIAEENRRLLASGISPISEEAR